MLNKITKNICANQKNQTKETTNGSLKILHNLENFQIHGSVLLWPKRVTEKCQLKIPKHINPNLIACFAALSIQFKLLGLARRTLN